MILKKWRSSASIHKMKNSEFTWRFVWKKNKPGSNWIEQICLFILPLQLETFQQIFLQHQRHFFELFNFVLFLRINPRDVRTLTNPKLIKACLYLKLSRHIIHHPECKNEIKKDESFWFFIENIIKRKISSTVSFLRLINTLPQIHNERTILYSGTRQQN